MWILIPSVQASLASANHDIAELREADARAQEDYSKGYALLKAEAAQASREKEDQLSAEEKSIAYFTLYEQESSAHKETQKVSCLPQ